MTISATKMALWLVADKKGDKDFPERYVMDDRAIPIIYFMIVNLVLRSVNWYFLKLKYQQLFLTKMV